MANLETNIRQANADFVAIKNKIVEHGVEIAAGTRTADYAQKVDAVYEAGLNEGKQSAGGGLDTSDATATADDILSGKTAYVNGEKVTGTIDEAEQATPAITVDANGLITATASQAAGYVAAGSRFSTKQLAFQPASTITPGAASKTAVPGGYYTTGDVVVAGDTNLVAENIRAGANIFGVDGTYEGEGAADAYALLDEFVGRSYTSYGNARWTSIPAMAFYSNSKLQSVNFPACTYIESSAFHTCAKLTDVNFPKVRTISSYAFTSCSSLTNVSFPACVTLGSKAFCSCSKLTTATFSKKIYVEEYAFYSCSNLTSLGETEVAGTVWQYAFGGCSNLTSVNLENCTAVLSYAFQGCKKLTSCLNMPECRHTYPGAFAGCGFTSVDLPKCSQLGQNTFANCSNLSSINIPNISSIGYGAFSNCGFTSMSLSILSLQSGVFNSCANLTTVNFPYCSLISSSAFAYCKKLSNATFGEAIRLSSLSSAEIKAYAFGQCSTLTNLTLYYPIVATLANVNAFSYTAITHSSYAGGTFGSIYVPASLVDAYKKATNWATYADRITAIPEVITFSIGDITYQAEENMTWGDWVNSQYNTDNYTVDEDGWIIHPDSRYITNDEVLYVPELAIHPILAGEVYILTN